MRKYFLPAISLVTALSGCVPATRLYLTPPVYFGSPHSLPATDSSKQWAISTSVILPTNAEVKCQYRINKDFLLNLSYLGNLGSYSNFNNNAIDYRYATSSFDFQLGYAGHKDTKKELLFISAGYGRGRTTSIIPEYDNSVIFFYKGEFSRFTLTPGIHFIETKKLRLSFSWRQSLIRLSSYELPEVSYSNKEQFLTDMMFNCYVPVKKMSLNLFLGSFLNGMQGGDRQLDQKPEMWRIERLFAGINLSYKFSFNKNAAR